MTLFSQKKKKKKICDGDDSHYNRLNCGYPCRKIIVKARKIISTFLDFGAYIKEKYHFWISPKHKMLSHNFIVKKIPKSIMSGKNG